MPFEQQHYGTGGDLQVPVSVSGRVLAVTHFGVNGWEETASVGPQLCCESSSCQLGLRMQLGILRNGRLAVWMLLLCGFLCQSCQSMHGVRIEIPCLPYAGIRARWS